MREKLVKSIFAVGGTGLKFVQLTIRKLSWLIGNNRFVWMFVLMILDCEVMDFPKSFQNGPQKQERSAYVPSVLNLKKNRFSSSQLS